MTNTPPTVRAGTCSKRSYAVRLSLPLSLTLLLLLVAVVTAGVNASPSALRRRVAGLARSDSSASAAVVADHRFRPSWETGYEANAAACTAELTGSSQSVITAERRQRLDLSPAGHGDAAERCGSTGGNGFYNEGATALTPNNQVAYCAVGCKAGFVASGDKYFQCDYPTDPAVLSKGPSCRGPSISGVAHGQQVELGPASVALKVILDDAATSDFDVTWSCSLDAGTPVTATAAVMANAQEGAAFAFPLTAAGSVVCTASSPTAGTAYTGWTYELRFSVIPQRTAEVTGITAGQNDALLVGEERTLTATVNVAVNADLTYAMECTDTASTILPVTAGTPSTLTIAAGQTSGTFTFAPNALTDGVATCTFTPSGDSDYASVAVNTLAFSVVTPTLTVTGLANNEVIATGSTRTLTLTANIAPASTVNVPVTCSAGTSSFQFVLAGGSKTATANWVGPGTAATGVTCSFGPATTTGDSDPAFSGLAVAPASVTGISFATPSLIVTGRNQNVFPGQQTSMTIESNVPIVGGPLIVSVACTNNAGGAAVGTLTPDAAFNIAGGGALVSDTVTRTAPLAAVAAATCSFSYVSGDARFETFVNNDGITPIRFTVAPPPLTLNSTAITNGAEVAPGSVQTLRVAGGQSVTVAALVLTVTCQGAAASPATVQIAIGQSANTVAVTAPAASASPVTVSCTVSRSSGDERYTSATSNAFTFVVPAAGGAGGDSSDSSSTADASGGETSSTGSGSDASGSSTADQSGSSGSGSSTGSGSTGAGAAGSSSSSSGTSTSSSSSTGGATGGDGAASSTPGPCADSECAATAAAAAAFWPIAALLAAAIAAQRQ